MIRRLTVLTLMLIANTSFADDNFFSMEEVAEHDSEESCWTVIDGEFVYDITEYAEDHPRRGGGSSVVYDMCGIDGTSLYDSVHASERYYLDSFSSIEMIGYIGSEEQPSEPPTGTEFPYTDPPTGTEFPTTYNSTNSTNMTETPSTSMPTNETGSSTTEPPTVTPTTLTPSRSILEEDLDTGLEVDLEELAYHNTPDDCWVAYFGDVYDMTTYAPTHPKVGPGVIYANCGEDGTDAYASVHPKSLLLSVEEYIIAPLNDGGPAVNGDDDKEAAAPAPTGEIIGLEILSKHDSIDDCWVAYYDNVYNMTKYAFLHPSPPGEYVIHMSCGRDGTVEYASIHAPDLLDGVKYTIVGKFDRSSSCPLCYFLTITESILLALTVALLTLGLQ